MNIYVVCGIMSAFFFAVMNTITSHKLSHFSSMALVFFRGLSTAMILLPFVYKKIPDLLRKQALPIHLRSLTGGIAILCLFWTLKNTSAIHASFLASFAPIFLSLILFLKNESKLSTLNQTGLVLIIFGTTMVSWSPNFHAALGVWFIGFMGAFLSALAMYFLKRSASQYTPLLIVFNLSVILALIGVSYWDSYPRNVPDWIFLSLMCLSSAVAQVLMTVSYNGLLPQVANGLGRSLIIWVALIELTLTHNLPTPQALFGYSLATIGIIALKWTRNIRA